jgi:transposase InsO family protein
LLIMGHGRRHILWFGVTAHPTAEWIANQVTEACGWEQAPRYLIRDRDGAYGGVFIRRLRSIGIRDRPTSPRSPWQNGYAERLIGSIRRECLDHVILFSERHLRHLLRCYMKYHNGAARIYPWRKMRRSRAPSIAPGTFFVAQSWADCITNMAVNLRQAQPVHPQFAESLRAARAAGILGAEVFTGKMVKGRVLPMKKAWAAKFKKYALLARVNEPKKSCHGVRKN